MSSFLSLLRTGLQSTIHQKCSLLYAAGKFEHFMRRSFTSSVQFFHLIRRVLSTSATDPWDGAVLLLSSLSGRFCVLIRVYVKDTIRDSCYFNPPTSFIISAQHHDDSSTTVEGIGGGKTNIPLLGSLIALDDLVVRSRFPKVPERTSGALFI